MVRVAEWVEGASILSMERDRPPGGKSLLETVGKAKPAAARRTRRELLCAWIRTVDSVGDGRHFAKVFPSYTLSEPSKGWFSALLYHT